MWLAPNMITLSGTLGVVLAYMVTIWYLPDFQGEYGTAGSHSGFARVSLLYWLLSRDTGCLKLQTKQACSGDYLVLGSASYCLVASVLTESRIALGACVK